MLIETLITARLYPNKTMRSFIIKNEPGHEFWIAHIDEYEDIDRKIFPSVEEGLLGKEEISAPIAFVSEESAIYKRIYSDKWHSSDARTREAGIHVILQH